jgi:hypothetical protein
MKGRLKYTYIYRSSETKSSLFQWKDKIDNPLAKVTKTEQEDTNW